MRVLALRDLDPDKHLLYALLNLDVQEEHIYGDLKFNFMPFYIGTGGKSSPIDAKYMPTHKKINSTYIILEVNLSASEANLKRKEYIAKIGTRSTMQGPLLNDC